MRTRALAAVTFVLGGVAAFGCGLFTDVDWDRVQTRVGPDGAPIGNGTSSSGASSSGRLPDGGPLPGTEDGGLPTGNCAAGQVECLSETESSGLGCCPRNDDKGVPIKIAAGLSNTCAVTSTGQVRCWGQNGNGQLGRGTDTALFKSNVPLNAFRIPSGAKYIAVGGAHVCAVVGKVVACWGSNAFSQFGNGSTANSSVPIVVKQMPAGNIAGITAGNQTTCASIDRKGYCWGENHGLQGGSANDQTILQPKLVADLPMLPAEGDHPIVAGKAHSCASTVSGFYCWGNNSSNRLGRASAPSMTHTPQSVLLGGTSSGTDLALGESHACGIVSGRLSCWGSNIFGELGNGGSQLSSDGAVSPTDMMSGVDSVCAGLGHTCVVKNNRVWCSGDNSQGQSGLTIANTKVFAQPQQTENLDARQVACGYLHTCALLNDNSIKCWGSNTDGQLGDGTTDQKSAVPRNVVW
jgi:alpha-tubulin suppressor-like RCC1 family protein